ncbi:MAG: shikimate kinase [Bacteroidota bacterium]
MKTYLIGFMGSGKSALGRQLAGLMNTAFLDLDEMFEERYHISIFDFFEKYDEDKFRLIEKELLFETAGLTNTVISTGGGTACFYDNMKFIRENGVSVYLRMTSGELAMRLKNVRKKRPLLKDLPPEGLEAWISSQLLSREVYYNQATHVFYPLQQDIRELVLKLT